MPSLKHWIWLAELRGVSNQTRLALLRHFEDPTALYYASPEEILLTEGITREQRRWRTTSSPGRRRSWPSAGTRIFVF